MADAADFDWAKSGSRILPGAICENLHEFRRHLHAVGGSDSALGLRAGGGRGHQRHRDRALCASRQSFPHAMIQVHYARGASLAEAFYQAVTSLSTARRRRSALPALGLDSRPSRWSMAVPTHDRIEPLQTLLAGTIELEPRATVPSDGLADRFELFVDGAAGWRQCGLGERLTRRHVHSSPTAITSFGWWRSMPRRSRSQGRWVQSVMFANHGRSLTLEAEPRRAKATGSVRLRTDGPGLEGVVLFAMGRVVGRTVSGDRRSMSSRALGRGPVTIRASGRAGAGVQNSVNAVGDDYQVEWVYPQGLKA